MTRGDIAFLDTNILLAATDTGRTAHDAAVSVFTELPGEGIHLAISGQVVREYLVAATRPVEQNGLGLGLPDALDNIAEFRSRTIFLEETLEVNNTLIEIIRSTGISGKRIHDINIAATILSHRMENLLTFNPEAFIGIGNINIRVPE